jgi:hypothetical protein
MHQIPRDDQPTRIRRAAGAHHVAHERGRDVDDFGMTDQLESEINWNRLHRANRRLDLRLDHTQWDRRLSRLPERVVIKRIYVADGPVQNARFVDVKESGNALHQRWNFESKARWACATR